MNKIFGSAIAGLSLLLLACSGKPVDSGSGEVRLVTAEQLKGCENVGSAHVSVADRYDRLQGVDGAVGRELQLLARASARQLGGNSIVEMTNVISGSQSFAVFRCP